MSVYLGYDDITKQYLRSLTGGGTSASSGSDLNINGFTMSGDINMGGNEVIGLDDPSGDSSATSKKYVDDEVAKITTSGGLDQAAVIICICKRQTLPPRTRLRRMPPTLFFPRRPRPSLT